MSRSDVRKLVRPQWVALLEELKWLGTGSVPELSQRLALSYMAVKQQCEDLVAIGVLTRHRTARTEAGRPRVSYRLAAGAGAYFPGPSPAMVLNLLETLRLMHGENAPERLMHHHFQRLAEERLPSLERAHSLISKLEQLAVVRNNLGHRCRVERIPEADEIALLEAHHPLDAIFERYPSCRIMDQRLIEAQLGAPASKVTIDDSTPGFRRIRYFFEIPCVID